MDLSIHDPHRSRGNCELRTECTVKEVVTDDRGRAQGVAYFDARGALVNQTADLVIVSCAAIESARLLLNSKSKLFDSRVQVDPRVKDRWGIPVARMSGARHPHSLEIARYISSKAEAWLKEAGAVETWEENPRPRPERRSGPPAATLRRFTLRTGF
jgi:GMC oxidoreductase